MPDSVLPETLVGRIVWPILIVSVFVLYYVGGVYSQIEKITNSSYKTWECYRKGVAVAKKDKIHITISAFSEALSTFSTLPVYLEIEKIIDKDNDSKQSITLKFSSNTPLYFCSEPASRSTCEPKYTLPISPSDIKKLVIVYVVAASSMSTSEPQIKIELLDDDSTEKPFVCTLLDSEKSASKETEDSITFLLKPPQDSKSVAHSLVRFLLLPPWANFVLPVAVTYFVVLGEQLWQFLSQRLEETEDHA